MDANTKIAGIIGNPISHSLSPVMQNAAFKLTNLNWCYLAFEVAEGKVGAAIAGTKALGISGLNVTMPHKQTVIPFLDELTAEARAVNAVNTIENKDGRLVGHNTDISGFIRAVEEVKGQTPIPKATIFGAGGSARAVSLALAKMGTRKISIVNRTLEKAIELKRLIEGPEIEVTALNLDDDFPEEIKTSSIIINATPSAPPIAGDALRDGQIACDLVYYGMKSNFLENAERKGLKTVDGLSMLLYQGADSFEIWTGVEAPVEVMRNAIQG